MSWIKIHTHTSLPCTTWSRMQFTVFLSLCIACPSIPFIVRWILLSFLSVRFSQIAKTTTVTRKTTTIKKSYYIVCLAKTLRLELSGKFPLWRKKDTHTHTHMHYILCKKNDTQQPRNLIEDECVAKPSHTNIHRERGKRRLMYPNFSIENCSCFLFHPFFLLIFFLGGTYVCVLAKYSACIGRWCILNMAQIGF